MFKHILLSFILILNAFFFALTPTFAQFIDPDAQPRAQRERAAQETTRAYQRRTQQQAQPAPPPREKGIFESFFSREDEPQPAKQAEPKRQQRTANQPQNRNAVRAAIPENISGQIAAPRQAEPPRERSLFQMLFGGSSEAHPFKEEMAPHPNAPVFVDPDSVRTKKEGGTWGRTYCVRLCDGAFMPITTGRSKGKEDDVEICQAQCPGAETKVFTLKSGNNLEEAVSHEGEEYLTLPNANKFKTSFDRTCSCKPQGKSWAEYAASLDDPTMRKNDKFLSEVDAKKMATAMPNKRNAPVKEPAAEQIIDATDIKNNFENSSVRIIEAAPSPKQAVRQQNLTVENSSELPKTLNPVERLLIERNLRRLEDLKQGDALVNEKRG